MKGGSNSFAKAILSPLGALYGLSARSRSQKTLEALRGALSRAPEVTVKVTGRQHGAAHVFANFTYIARHMKMDEDLGEEGRGILSSEGPLKGRVDMKTLALEWQLHEEADQVRRKGSTAISLILSMPEGTDPRIVFEAARGFAETEMANRRWVLALHTDTGKPHAHLTVARRDLDGRRFHPDRQTLIHYRERFAEELRSRGVEASATSRRARGVTRRPEQPVIARIKRRGAVCHSDTSLREGVQQLWREGKRAGAGDPHMREQRADVLHAYERAGRELAERGGEQGRRLALEIAKFCSEMPRPRSRTTEILDEMSRIDLRRSRAPKNRDRT